MAGNYRGFRHGQNVRHRRWTDQAGKPLTGTVWVFALSTQERAHGCAEAEVRWHGSFVADQLDLVINDISGPGADQQTPTV